MSNRRDFFKQALVLPLVGRLFQSDEEQEQPTEEIAEAVVPVDVITEPLCRHGEYMVKIGGQLMILENGVISWDTVGLFARHSFEISAFFYGTSLVLREAIKEGKELPFTLSTFVEGDKEYRGQCVLTSLEISLLNPDETKTHIEAVSSTPVTVTI